MALGMEKLIYVGQSMGGKIGMTYAQPCTLIKWTG